jgi:putative addiction module killer protein
VVHGNPGQYRHLTDSISELKIDQGPGYCVYCSQRGERLLLLLARGDKSTLQRDVSLAVKLAKNMRD